MKYKNAFDHWSIIFVKPNAFKQFLIGTPSYAVSCLLLQLMQTGPNGASSAPALCLVEMEHTLGQEHVPIHHQNSTDRTA